MSIQVKKTVLACLGVSVILAACGASFAAEDVTKIPITSIQPAKAAATVVISPKFLQFDPAKYDGETGSIVLPAKCEIGLTLRKLEDGQLGDYLSIKSKGKVIACPVGNYKLWNYNLTVEGKNGQRWSINSRYMPQGQDQTLEVKMGEKTNLDLLSTVFTKIQSGKTGKISLPYAGESSIRLHSTDDGKPGFDLSTSSKDKTLIVPAGKYQVTSYSVDIKGKNGVEWHISTPYVLGNDTKVVEVKPNSELKIAAVGQMASSLKNGKTGTITLPGAGQNSVSLSSIDNGKSGDQLNVTSTNKALLLPAGTYQLNYCSLNVTDKNGQKYALNSNMPGGKPKMLVVKPGGSVALGNAVQFAKSIETGKTGVISLPYSGASAMQLNTMDDGKPGFSFSLSTKESTLKVPAGEYQVVSYSVTSSDTSGNKFDIAFRSDQGSAPRVIEVSPDSEASPASGGQLSASIENAQNGEITLPYDGESSLALTEIVNDHTGDTLSLKSNGQTLKVPAGKYKIGTYYANINDKDGSKWSFGASAPSEKNASIEVKPGASVKLDISEPLEASVSVIQDGDKIAMSLQLFSANGYRCTIRAFDPLAKAPGFEMLSKSGEVLLSGNFAYG